MNKASISVGVMMRLIASMTNHINNTQMSKILAIAPRTSYLAAPYDFDMF